MVDRQKRIRDKLLTLAALVIPGGCDGTYEMQEEYAS